MWSILSTILCQNRKVKKNKPSSADFLKSIRTEMKLSQRAVAKAAGMQLTSYQRFETGKSQLLSSHAKALADVLGIPLTALIGVAESPSFVSVNSSEQRIALLEYAEAAKLADKSKTLNDLKVVERIPYHGEPSTMVFALRIEDESMEPRFKRGDILAIDVNQRDNVSPGSVVAAALNHGQTVIGTYHKLRSGFEIHPANPTYPSFDSSKDPLTIIGKAIQRLETL
jgi:SOS-response transcriptional repressor LexA